MTAQIIPFPTRPRPAQAQPAYNYARLEWLAIAFCVVVIGLAVYGLIEP